LTLPTSSTVPHLSLLAMIPGIQLMILQLEGASSTVVLQSFAGVIPTSTPNAQNVPTVSTMPCVESATHSTSLNTTSMTAYRWRLIVGVEMMIPWPLGGDTRPTTLSWITATPELSTEANFWTGQQPRVPFRTWTCTCLLTEKRRAIKMVKGYLEHLLTGEDRVLRSVSRTDPATGLVGESALYISTPTAPTARTAVLPVSVGHAAQSTDHRRNRPS